MKTEEPMQACPKHPEARVYITTSRCVECALEDAVAMPWPVMTQKEAIEKGLRKYWTGKICINGHVKQRYTVSGICIGCNAMNSAKRNRKKRAELTARRGGLKLITFTVHLDDAKAIEAYATTLTTLRGL